VGHYETSLMYYFHIFLNSISVALAEALAEYEYPAISFPTYSESCNVKDLTPSADGWPAPPTLITWSLVLKFCPCLRMPFSIPSIATLASHHFRL